MKIATLTYYTITELKLFKVSNFFVPFQGICLVHDARNALNYFQDVLQPRKPGSLPTSGAVTRDFSKIYCSVGWGKYQITCLHIQATHFKCKERGVVVVQNGINFLN